MRVYRPLQVFIQGKYRSLIICEGVSNFFRFFGIISAFPHYMWGCIVFLQVSLFCVSVPSLYVRVYRRITGKIWQDTSSLIICEGVSCFNVSSTPNFGFPHYMWGCIGRRGDCVRHRGVPSLYVRVYRYEHSTQIELAGSLIICEGVSWNIVILSNSEAFPHYMWGCIGKGHYTCRYDGVPSLYVRVYRKRGSLLLL